MTTACSLDAGLRFNHGCGSSGTYVTQNWMFVVSPRNWVLMIESRVRFGTAQRRQSESSAVMASPRRELTSA